MANFANVEYLTYQEMEVPVLNILYMSSKGVLSPKKVVVYHVSEDRSRIYGHRIPLLPDDPAFEISLPSFISLRRERIIEIFPTHDEAIAAFEHAEITYQDRIDEIKSDPSFKGRKHKNDHVFKVCFTGFSKTDKAELVALAEGANMKVATSVSASLDFLCCGSNAGWAKMKKANEVGVPLVRDDQIRLLVETGELPESYSETL